MSLNAPPQYTVLQELQEDWGRTRVKLSVHADASELLSTGDVRGLMVRELLFVVLLVVRQDARLLRRKPGYFDSALKTLSNGTCLAS